MSVENVLDAASRNLFSSPGAAPPAHEEIGVLLVADPPGVRGYDRLLGHGNGTGPHKANHWLVEASDNHSISFRQASGGRIIAVRGQQLITREGLEVLGIGHEPDLASGLSLAMMVERISAAGGWSIIAWGAGKWIGSRGRLVTEMIVSEKQRSDVMLADNGGRPWFWSRVPQFEVAREQGMRVLAGTDPLPLKGEESRVGSYGFSVSIDPSTGQSVFDSFRRALEDPSIPTHIIGKQMTIGRFASNQMRIRLP